MYLSITTLHHCWHGLILFSSAVHARTRITSSQPLESWQPVPATAPACPGSTRKVDCSWPWPSSLLTSRPSAWSGNCLQVISFSSCLFVYCQKFAQKSPPRVLLAVKTDYFSCLCCGLLTDRDETKKVAFSKPNSRNEWATRLWSLIAHGAPAPVATVPYTCTLDNLETQILPLMQWQAIGLCTALDAV